MCPQTSDSFKWVVTLATKRGREEEREVMLEVFRIPLDAESFYCHDYSD